MELQVTYCPGPVRVLVQGPADSQEMQEILERLQGNTDGLWVTDEQRNAVRITSKEVVWAEVIEEKTFIYTAEAMYQSSCSLAALEAKWEHAGFFRCGKSTAFNLNAARTLSSRPGGRIEALLQTGEKVVISRRYAPILRDKLQGG